MRTEMPGTVPMTQRIPRLPAVTVVIVTFNSAAVLGGCLDSLVEGCCDVSLREVIVADNASQDDSVQIADEYTALRSAWFSSDATRVTPQRSTLRSGRFPEPMSMRSSCSILTSGCGPGRWPPPRVAGLTDSERSRSL